METGIGDPLQALITAITLGFILYLIGSERFVKQCTAGAGLILAWIGLSKGDNLLLALGSLTCFILTVILIFED